MQKFTSFAVLLLTLVFIPFSYGRDRIISEFVGGIDQTKAKFCLHQIEQSQCKLKELFSDYKRCVQKVLISHALCKQSFTFFKLTNGGIFNKIRTYNNIDVILADYVYIADQGTGYFLVAHNGLFLPIPLNITKKKLRMTSGYSLLPRKYLPVTEAWQIVDFPYDVKLSGNRYRLVFTQVLKNGCNACAIVGHIKVGYDFSNDGKIFKGAKPLKIIPLS